MGVSETKNRTSLLYEQYLLLWKYNSKSEIFENLEYLSNKINAETNIQLWNPEHWFLTKQI